MTPRARTLLVALALAAPLAACGKKPDAPPAGSATPGSAAGSAVAAAATDAAPAPPPPPTTDAAPAAPTGPRGRTAPDNNPKLVELATANEACTIDPYYPTNSCSKQVSAFEAAFDATKDLPTLINLLEDPNVQVRYVAVRALADRMVMQTSPGRGYAPRILAAAAAETEPANATMFGQALLQGDFADPTFADAIAGFFDHHPLPAMRAAIASNLAVQGEAKWLPVMIARYAVEPDKSVKQGILAGTYLAQDAATVCPFLLEAMKDPDGEIAGDAAYGIVWSNGKCKDSYDAFLTAYAARLASTKVDFQYVLKIAYMAKAPGATDAQKAAFAEASKVIVADTKLSGMARAKMLETIGDKAYAKGFLKDPDSFVAEAAQKLQK